MAELEQHLQAIQRAGWYVPTDAYDYIVRSIPRLQRAAELGLGYSQHVWDAAVRNGDLTVLQWLQDQNCARDDDAAVAAAMVCGQTATFQWLYANGYLPDVEKCAAAAAQYGHTHIVLWLATVDARAACRGVAGVGDAEILMWLKINGHADV